MGSRKLSTNYGIRERMNEVMDAECVVDTDVVSFVMRGRQLARMYARHINGRVLSVSFITVGELYFGAEKAGWGERRRTRLEDTLDSFTVVPYDRGVARCYGRVVAERQRIGNPIAQNDAWIAACAVRHALPLVTHNYRHFEGISGLRLITESGSARTE